MACELFGFAQDELIGVQLNELVSLRPKTAETLAENHLQETGEIVEVSGKVVSFVSDVWGMDK